MTITELVANYLKVFGEHTRSCQRLHLIRLPLTRGSPNPDDRHFGPTHIVIGHPCLEIPLKGE